MGVIMQHGAFHEGELDVQERAGEREIAARTGGSVGDAIPARAVPFLAEQRLLVVGSLDADGAPRASVLFGDRGLIASVAERVVVVDRARLRVVEDDPLWRNLRVGGDLGLLAIELASRRRLRINGIVSAVVHDRIEVTVREAYSNCPKYIQRRHFGLDPGAFVADPGPVADGTALDPARSRLIERADTLFVASRHPARGVDVSHRGGEPGFVRLVTPDRLRIPDYRGNSMFNTLGNFAVDDRAGLVFLDFEGARLLQLKGTVTVGFDEAEDPRQPTGGTGRYWHVEVERWLELPVPGGVAWELLDRSPHNPIQAV
jgi:predicted pyridoxine 5'-phosphate oxidase superfamily flavin-nucleotide-binding protein